MSLSTITTVLLPILETLSSERFDVVSIKSKKKSISFGWDIAYFLKWGSLSLISSASGFSFISYIFDHSFFNSG